MKNIFKISLLINSFFFLTCCSSSKKLQNRDWLKEYAFCKCLEYATKDSFLSNDLSVSVYKEIANYDPSVYQIIDSLSRKKALEILPSQIADYDGKKAILVSCFNFYKSKTLDSVVKKMDTKILPGFEKR